MTRMAATFCGVACLFLGMGTPDALAQKPPYDAFPPADPPYYRVRYEASTGPGELAYAVNYTVWIPPGVKALRGEFPAAPPLWDRFSHPPRGLGSGGSGVGVESRDRGVAHRPDTKK